MNHMSNIKTLDESYIKQFNADDYKDATTPKRKMLAKVFGSLILSEVNKRINYGNDEIPYDDPKLDEIFFEQFISNNVLNLSGKYLSI